MVKDSSECELYLKIGLCKHDQKRMAQFRTSSHRYKVETGRYGLKRNSVVNRICEYCSPDVDVVPHLSVLPLFESIIEDEEHTLYTQERKQLKSPLTSVSDFSNASSCVIRTTEIARLIRKCHNKKFPETVDETPAPKKPKDQTKVEGKRRKVKRD